MKLGDWLQQHNVSRTDFARRIGLSKGAISQICNQDDAWVSRETALLILRETDGAVTPNDFLMRQTSWEAPVVNRSITEAIQAIARGELVILVDDDDR